MLHCHIIGKLSSGNITILKYTHHYYNNIIYFENTNNLLKFQGIWNVLLYLSALYFSSGTLKIQHGQSCQTHTLGRVFEDLLNDIFLLIYCVVNNSIDGAGFFNFTVSFQFSTFKANLLGTGVKFSLINKFVLGISIAFLSMDWSFFLFRSAFKQCFLLITQTMTFFFLLYFIRSHIDIYHFLYVNDFFF